MSSVDYWNYIENEVYPVLSFVHNSFVFGHPYMVALRALSAIDPVTFGNIVTL